MATGRWVRVVAVVAPGALDLAADALWQAGAAGIEEQATDGDEVRLLAGFATRSEARAAVTRVGDLSVAATIEEIGDHGLDAWREHARPERAGPFWLVPTWLDPPAEATPDAVLRLDPGRTFGSGSHPTTRLVLAHLAALVRPGDRVLDVGTGSGVLAVGAARLGAASVVAIDIDEGSPAVVDANARANDVADRIAASTTPLADLVAEPGFVAADVVAANLLAPVIRDLAASLVAAAAPDGWLVVSGLLADRWSADVRPLLPLEPIEAMVDDGWAAVVLARPSSARR